MTTVITLTAAIVLITLMFCITLIKSKSVNSLKNELREIKQESSEAKENKNKKHAFDKPVNSELSEEQKQSLLDLKEQVNSFKLQSKINEIDDLVSLLKRDDYSDEEKLSLADEIANKVDQTLKGDEQPQVNKSFKVIQGWGASMKVG